MNRALQIAHMALLIAATAFIGVAAWQGLLLARDVRATVATANAALAHLNGKTGTIAMLDEDLGAAKSAVIHADLIARHEQQQLSTLDTQELTLFADLHDTAQAARKTLDAGTGTANAATTAVATAGETIEKLKATEDAATASLNSLNKIVADSSIPKMLANTAAITSDAARITKDAADEADKLAHPPIKRMTFWGSIDAALLYFHSHIAPPIF